MRRGAQGRDQALGVQGVRHRLHARSTRSGPAWSPRRAPAPPTTTTAATRANARSSREPAETKSPAGREQRILEIIETTRAKRPRFKDERITMAHGAGGKATQTLIEGLFAPAFGSEQLEELADSGTFEVGISAKTRTPGGEAEDVARLAMTTDTFVVKPLRFPGGSIGELAVNGTVNDLAAAGAKPLAITLAPRARGGPRRRTSCAPRSRRSRTPRRPPGSRSSPATPRSSSAATATGCTSSRPGSAGSIERATLRTGALEPGDRVLVSRTIGEHGTAIMLARGELGLEAEVESDTRSLWPVADALLESAGGCLRTMRDATRGGVATVLNELARAPGSGSTCARPHVPVRPDVAGRLRAARNRSDVRRQRGRDGRLRRARGRSEDALDALRSVPGCEAAAEIARGPGGAARDGAGRDGVRRPAGDGPAGRRSAAEDLLRTRSKERGSRWR